MLALTSNKLQQQQNKMKQLNSNFKTAKIGDTIYHVDGRSFKIDDIRPTQDYCIVANDFRTYTSNGRYLQSNKNPSIFTHPIKIIHADDEPFVERVMEVSDYEDFRDKKIRVVFAQKCGYFISWSNVRTIEETKLVWNTTNWNYAREVQPVNPRIAEIEREIQRLQNELETLKEVSK
jgi:hypothetical protein